MRGIVAATACAEVLTLWHTLRRYMVGLDGSLTLQHAKWHPPINPWIFIAINAAAIAWLALSALAQPPPSAEPNPVESLEVPRWAPKHSTGFKSDDVAEDVDDEVGGAGVVVERQVAAGAELQVGQVRHGYARAGVQRRRRRPRAPAGQTVMNDWIDESTDVTLTIAAVAPVGTGPMPADGDRRRFGPGRSAR